MEHICFVCQDDCTIRACQICTISYLHRECLQSLIENGFDSCPGCSVKYCLDTLPTLDSKSPEQVQEIDDRVPSTRALTQIERAIRHLEEARKKRTFTRWAGRTAPSFAEIFKIHQDATNDHTELNICMEAMLMSIASSPSHLGSFRRHLRKTKKRIYNNHQSIERTVDRDICYMHMICSDCSRWDPLAPLFEEKVKRCMQKTRVTSHWSSAFASRRQRTSPHTTPVAESLEV